MIFLKLLTLSLSLIFTLYACRGEAPKVQNPAVAAPATPAANIAAPAKPAANNTPGKQLFVEKGCIICHKINGEGGEVGPSLAGIMGETVELSTGQKLVRDHEYFEESILNPNARIVKGYQPGIMPKIGLTHEQIDDLGDFIKSLKKVR